MSDDLREDDDLPEPRGWFLKVAAIVLVVSLLGYFGLRPARNAAEETRSLPAFELPLLMGGGTLSSDDLEGSVVVLNFWASWCGPCREEMPAFERIHRRYEDRGLIVVGVDVQDVPQSAREFVREVGVTYPIVQDLDQTLLRAIGDPVGLPQTYFVRADGTLEAAEADGKRLGAISEEELEAAVQRLLGTAAP